jgi:hypothetical protein
MYKSDLDESLFVNDVFYWDAFTNKGSGQDTGIKKLEIGHFFRLKKVIKMIDKHESYLIRWVKFIEDHSN